MNAVLIALIRFYQRFISPSKGFRCAHHCLHQRGSCSTAVIQIIQQKGLLQGWSDIRARFADCKTAYQALLQSYHQPNADLPCDIDISNCSPDIGDFGGDKSSSNCSLPCDLPCDCISDIKRKHRKWLILFFVIILLALSYWFYGRGVGSVYIEDTKERSSLIQHITQRDKPEVRLLLLSEGKKYYSDTIQLEKIHTTYQFTFKDAPLGEIESLQILDTRMSMAGNLVTVSQVLADFKSPKTSGNDERFSYRIKRRWHF